MNIFTLGVQDKSVQDKNRNKLFYFKKTAFTLLFLLVVLNAFSGTFYSQGNLNAALPGSWNTVPGGGGTAAVAANFTDGSTFIIQAGNAMTTGSAWTLSGAGSTLQINGGSLTVTNLVNVVNITIGGGTLTLTSNDIQVNGGAWTYNFGTFVPGTTRSIIFTGTSTIGGALPTIFYLITISTGTLTAAANFTVNGTFKNNVNINAFVPGIYTVTFNGATTSITTQPTAFNNLTISSGILSTSVNLTVKGAFTNNSSTTAFSPSNQTVTFVTGSSINGSFATTFCSITINTTLATDIVPLNVSTATIKSLGGVGTLTLTKGIFKVGTGHSINFDNNSSTNGLANNGGDIATTNSGQDGGTIVLLPGSGANLNITGSSVVHFYNFTFGTGVGNANRQVAQSTASTVIINGTLTMQDNQSKWATNSPIYASGSLLYINNNNGGYTPGSGTRLEWMAIAPGTGTIGTTVGYPDNVTLVNVGGSVTDSCGFAPSGSWSVNSTFSIGDGTVSGAATLESMTAFSCLNVVIDKNSVLRTISTTAFTVKGNWTQKGSPIGRFVPVTDNTSTVTFGGSGTSASPQTIQILTGFVPFGGLCNSNTYYANLKITNGTYVKLLSPTTLQSSNTLTLTSGILETSSGNLLRITNNSTGAIIGGGAATYINGPVLWYNAATTSANYVFPVGTGTSKYMPFILFPNTTTADSATVQAVSSNCGGHPDGTTIFYLDSAEYWTLTTSANFTTGANVSVSKPTAVSPYNMLAKSATLMGAYSGIGGTASGTSVTNAGSIGTASPWYITLAYGPLSIYVASKTGPSCAGNDGSITVAGSGGVPPYQYKMGSGSYQASGTFPGLSAGTYVFTVIDAAFNTATDTVRLSSLTVTPDTASICSGSSVQLTASGGSTYTWTGAGLSSTIIANPIATPGTTTTYTVTSPNYTNLLANPDFETVSPIPSGFSTDYTLATTITAIPYGAAPQPHNGLYTLVKLGTNMCSGFSATGPESGTYMMAVDGPDNGTAADSSSRIWYETINSLTIGTSYTFSYYTMYADNNNINQIETKINGVSQGFTTPTGSWAQTSYTWIANATSATIALYDVGPNWSKDIGNDFYLDNMAFLVFSCNYTANVTITVNPTPILTNATTPTTCLNTGALISLTGLNHSQTFTVAYTLNGVVQTPAIVTSDALGNGSFTTRNLTPADNGTLQITSLSIGGCTQTFAKNVTITVSPSVTWLGGFSANWNFAANWCGFPDSTTDVIIPGGTTYEPVLSSLTGATKSITIQSGSGASVTVNGTGILSIAGSITNSGTFDATAGTLRMCSTTGAQTLDGGAFISRLINNLIICNASGVSLIGTSGDTLNISGALSFGNVSTTFATNNNLTLVSSASATARVADITNNGANSNTISGNVIVERYIQSHRAWRLLTAPINVSTTPQTINASWQEGQTNTATTGSGHKYNAPGTVGYGTEITNTLATNPLTTGYDSAVTDNPSILYLNAAGTGWAVPPNTNGTNVNGQQGYMLFVRGDRSVIVTKPVYNPSTVTRLRVKGNLIQGTVLYTPTVSPAWHVVGNPYASETKLDHIFTAYASTVGSAYDVWDPMMTGLQGVGAFFAVTHNSDGTYSAITHISPFVLGTLESSEAIAFYCLNTSSLSFLETDKNTGSGVLVFRPADDPIASFRTDLYSVASDGSTNLDDGTLTLYNSQYSNSVNWIEDAKKLGNAAENMSLKRNGQTIAIEKRQPIVATDTIFLSIANMKQQTYQFVLAADQINQAGLSARLEDQFLGSSTPVSLTDTTKINFNVTSDPASQGGSRFRVVFEISSGNPLPVTYTSVKAWEQNTNTIQVQWNVANELNINYYEIERSTDGVNFTEAGTVKATGGASLQYNWLDAHAVTGVNYYRIVSIGANSTVRYSEVVKVNIGAGSPLITLYPNPINNGIINLQFTNMPAGNYSLRLLNIEGQQLMLQSVNVGSVSDTKKIALDKALSKGTYELEVSGPDNSKTTLKVLNF
jgi:hypothetical protein